MLTQVTFHGFAPSEALHDRVIQKIEELKRYSDRIVSCRVALELPHRHQRQGKQFHVRIDVALPGAEIAVARDPDGDGHADPFVAVADAFTTARRRMRDHLRRRNRHRV